jgi:hypothetical protein
VPASIPQITIAGRIIIKPASHQAKLLGGAGGVVAIKIVKTQTGVSKNAAKSVILTDAF